MEKISARAILVDQRDHLVLIRRTPPESAPYWTTPGGRVEPSDRSIEGALRRELLEELGASATVFREVFVEKPSPRHPSRQLFFLAALESMDLTLRSGPELVERGRGGYGVEIVDVAGRGLGGIDLRPRSVAAFLRATWPDLCAEVRRRRSGTLGSVG